MEKKQIDEVSRILGKVESCLTSIKEEQARQGSRIEKIDTRLRNQEKQSAKHGAIAGTFASIVTSLAAFSLRGSL